MLLLAIVSVVMVVREAVSFCRLGRARYSYNWFDVILVVIVAGNGILYFVVNVELKGVMDRIKPPRDQRIFVSFQVYVESWKEVAGSRVRIRSPAVLFCVGDHAPALDCAEWTRPPGRARHRQVLEGPQLRLALPGRQSNAGESESVGNRP